MAKHAELSPSAALRWMSCPGSVALCKDLEDTGSKFADEGTDAHELAALCLETGADASTYAGRVMPKGFLVNSEMVLAVQDYLDYVRLVVANTNGQLMIEQRLPITDITGEDDAHGTADVVILTADELIVVDLKYGRGLAVEADDNPQLQIYALAAYREFSLAQDFQTVRLVIHQPRLGAVSEWVETVEDLEGFAQHVWNCAINTRNPDAMLNPTDKGCIFCRAKATCPAIRAVALEAFDKVEPLLADDNDLAEAMTKADLIEGWLKAVRSEVETRLLAGTPVAGFKIVQGKRGNRTWSDRFEVETLLKSMRLKIEEMYDLTLISPTTAEKLAKSAVIGPRQWPKLQTLISQTEGKPSVAPESDKRPALLITVALDDLDDASLPCNPA